MATESTNPFKGLTAYGSADERQLFARDHDLQLVRDRVFSGLTTLLFAASGVGKTSFLRAKLIPDLTREDYRVLYCRDWSGIAPLESVGQAFPESARDQPGGKSLRDRLVGGPWVLILDQFEEVFQQHAWETEFDEFRDQLSEVVNSPDRKVRLILSMREEFLGELSAFDNRVPDLFGNYYRLKNPDRRQAKEIVRRTCALREVEVDEIRLESLIQDLCRLERKVRGRSEGMLECFATREVLRDFVLPPYLQLVCQRRWEEEKPGGGREFLAGYEPGLARRTLRIYCEERLGALTPEERRIAARAMDFLVTRQGAKMAYELGSLAEHMLENPEKLRSALTKLADEDNRILRQSDRSDGSTWHELYHDMLAPVLFDWKDEFQREERSRQQTAHDKTKQTMREVEPLLLKALEILKGKFGTESLEVAEFHSDLGALFESQGRVSDAEQAFRESIRIREASHEGGKALALDYYRLGRFYEAQNRHAEAEEFLRRCLGIREKSLGEADPDLLLVRNRLASILEHQGRYEEAEILSRRAMRNMEDTQSRYDPEVASNIQNLARLFRLQGRFAEAEPLLRRSLQVREKIHGPESPEVAATLTSFAQLYGELGRYPEAERFYRRALEIRERANPPDGASIAETLNGMGDLMAKEGRYGDAKTIFNRALELRREACGIESPEVAESLHGMGGALALESHPEEAAVLLKQAQTIREKILGADHPLVAETVNALAGVCFDLRRYKEAENLFLRALDIRRKRLGEKHAEVAITMNDLAVLYNNLGRHGDAERLYRQALAVTEHALGPEHPDVAAVLHNLACVYANLGRDDEALELFRKSCAIWEKAVGGEYPELAKSLQWQAEILRKKKQFEESNSLLRRALSISETAFGRRSPAVVAGTRELAKHFHDLGDHPQGEKLAREALELTAKISGPASVEAAIDHHCIANALYFQKRYPEAESEYREAIRIVEGLPEKHEFELANILRDYSTLLGSMKRADAAAEIKARETELRNRVALAGNAIPSGLSESAAV